MGNVRDEIAKNACTTGVLVRYGGDNWNRDTLPLTSLRFSETALLCGISAFSFRSRKVDF